MASKMNPDTLSFEAAYQALQDVIGQLERGDLTLADSLAAYELGTKLLRRCTVLLDQAELRVKVLSDDLRSGFSGSGGESKDYVSDSEEEEDETTN